MARSRAPVEEPQGLVYQPDFIDAAEEAVVLHEVDRVDFHAVVMHGQTAPDGAPLRLELAPRSAYVLGGEARTRWQHSIPATKELRYSITFRIVPDPARWGG